MKKVIIPVLIILVAVHVFSQWLIVLDYQLNREYIAANLCENRQLPKLKCKGKCLLTKKLAEDNNPTSVPSPASGKVKMPDDLFLNAFLPSRFEFGAEENLKYQLVTNAAGGILPPCSVFHPPAV